MEIIPAIDLIEGKCVRLTEGDYAQKKIYNDTHKKENSEARKKYYDSHKNEIIEHYKSKIGDSIIKFKNKNIIIKIDVEGFEKEVLYGLKKLLSQNKILIQIEIFQRNFNKINKILNKHKFKLINQIKNSNDFYYTNN